MQRLRMLLHPLIRPCNYVHLLQEDGSNALLFPSRRDPKSNGIELLAGAQERLLRNASRNMGLTAIPVGPEEAFRQT